LVSFLEQRKIIKTLQMIHDSGKNAAVIVRNMLDFARKGGAYKADFKLVEIVEETLELMGKDIKNCFDFNNINIQRNYINKDAIISCDKGQIQQVLLNLFKNGAEAMVNFNKERESIFRIEVASNSNMVVLTISDNGSGIPKDIAKNVFDPFYTTKSPDKGTGLGLSISFFIVVQNHGGEMYLDENYKDGTKFIIKFPSATSTIKKEVKL